jgi:hypothetical protein
MGIVVMLVVTAAFGWATWYLLFKPLPQAQTVRIQPMNARLLQGLALLMGVGGFSIVLGAFWDEVWHRRYGIPFGEDFFWRPHLLMYFGFGSVTLLAFAGLYLLTRRGQGTFRQRFRANPVVGLVILVGGFLMYVLPADPIWHSIYGEDIAAWSIPHLLLTVSFVLILLLAIAVHMSTQLTRAWGSLRQLGVADVLPLMMFATMILMSLQFFTTEWDAGVRYVLARPNWLLPVVISGSAALIGTMANHTLRIFGAATLSGLIALLIRFALIRLFGVRDFMFVTGWVLILPSLLGIDLWYAYRQRTGRDYLLWVGAGIAASLGMVLVLLTVFQQSYPVLPSINLPIAVGLVLVGCLGTSWLGAAIGDYFAESNKQAETTAIQSPLRLASLGVVLATAVFVVVFVTTAVPPV